MALGFTAGAIGNACCNIATSSRASAASS